MATSTHFTRFLFYIFSGAHMTAIRVGGENRHVELTQQPDRSDTGGKSRNENSKQTELKWIIKCRRCLSKPSSAESFSNIFLRRAKQRLKGTKVFKKLLERHQTSSQQFLTSTQKSHTAKQEIKTFTLCHSHPPFLQFSSSRPRPRPAARGR